MPCVSCITSHAPYAQVDDPEPDIADSANYPDVRFIRSAELTGDEPYPDAELTQPWSVPDGGRYPNVMPDRCGYPNEIPTQLCTRRRVVPQHDAHPALYPVAGGTLTQRSPSCTRRRLIQYPNAALTQPCSQGRYVRACT